MQRYVSKELTHFVGKNLETDVQRYNLLKKILEEGCLSSSKGKNNNVFITIRKNSDYFRKIESSSVCFCDIPLTDLQLHMNKYSKFGLSFKKEFLIEKGVNPVFYFIIDHLESGRGSRTNKGLIINDILDVGDEIYKKFQNDKTTFKTNITNEFGEKIGRATMNFKEWHDALSEYIFSHIKLIKNASESKNDENFYMEREWRTIYSIKFFLRDVYRVIIPKQFSKKFYSDFSSKFIGQISFSDD